MENPRSSKTVPESSASTSGKYDKEPTDDSRGTRFGCGCSYSWTIVVLLSVAMIFSHFQRINLSVTLLSVAPSEELNATTIGPIADQAFASTSWTPVEIGLLHSGYYAGFLIAQIPAAIASYYFLPHRTLAVGLLISGSLNLLLPFLIIHQIYSLVLIVRFLQGLLEGVLWPASYVLLNSWAAQKERYRASGIVAAGSYAGPILGFPLCSLIVANLGWPYVFYFSGGACMAWTICWMVFSSDTPENHPYISEQEMMCLKNETVQLSADWKSTPWASMLRSKPFIALCLCSFAKGWVFDLLLAEAPTFLNAFNLTVEEIGLFSALPFALRLALSYLSAIIGDYFINRNILSQTTARKLLNTIGFGTEAACLFSMGFIYSGSACVILLTIGSGTAGLYVSGWQTNHLDLAPQYVGILVAVTQSMSNLAGIIGPLLATYFISIRGKLTFGREIPPNISEDIYAWHMTFLISALIDATGCAFYATFASGELQPWATEEENTEELSPVASTSGAKSSYNAINQNKIR